jgi:hypothetical protein
MRKSYEACVAASGKGSAHCAIRELISYGMNPNAHKEYHRIPLRYTLDNGSASAFEVLVALGADIDSIDAQRE